MRSLIVLLTIGVIVFSVGMDLYGADTGRLYAGTAKVVISPEHEVVAASSGGGQESWRLPDGVTAETPKTTPSNLHDDVYARALVLDNGITSVAIVSLDLILYGSEYVVSEAKSRYGVDHVILNSSHTHASMIPRGMCPTVKVPPMNNIGWGWDYVQDNPADVIDWPALSEDPWYAETEEKIIGVIGDAMNNKFAASIVSDRGAFQSDHMSHNRHYVLPDGSVRDLWENPGGAIATSPVDETVGFVRIDDDSGTPRAFMTHYASHPSGLMDSGIISRDFPGVAVDYVESQLGDQCQGMFLQGASGDIDPYFVGGETFELVEQQGVSVGQNVMAAMNASLKQGKTNVSIQVREEMVTLGQRGDHAGETTDALVSTIVIDDDLALVSMPGEVFTQHQLDLYAESPIEDTFLLGITYSGAGSPYMIYVPTEQAAIEGGYGAAVNRCSYLAGNAGSLMVDQALASIKDMGFLHPVPGDANEDGVVDLQDFGIMKHYFGMPSGATRAHGDFNGDGTVTLDDFNILKANFAASDSPIPEPATAMLVIVGAVVVIRRRCIAETGLKFPAK